MLIIQVVSGLIMRLSLTMKKLGRAQLAWKREPIVVWALAKDPRGKLGHRITCHQQRRPNLNSYLMENLLPQIPNPVMFLTKQLWSIHQNSQNLLKMKLLRGQKRKGENTVQMNECNERQKWNGARLWESGILLYLKECTILSPALKIFASSSGFLVEYSLNILVTSRASLG